MPPRFIKPIKINLLIFLPLIFILTGCVYSKSSNIMKNLEIEKQERTTITMWLNHNTSNNIQTKLLDEFNKTSKDIKVEYEVFGDNYSNMLTIALKSGNPPDIFEIESNWSIPKLVEGNYIESIEDYLSQDLKSKFFPGIFMDKEYLYKGKIYSLPERFTYYTLLYNKTLFRLAGLDPDKPPRTLEELREYSKRITEIGDGKFYGFILPMKSHPFVWKSIVDNLSAMHGQTAESGYDWEIGRFDFIKQKPFLEFIIQLSEDSSIFPKGLYIDEEKARVLFAQNKVGMMVSGNFMSNILDSQIITDSDWNFAKMPLFSNQFPTASGIVHLSQARVISSSSKNKDSSWKVLEYIFKNQEMTIKEGDIKSTIISANNSSPSKHIKGYEEAKQLGMYYTNFYISPHLYLDLQGQDRDEVYFKIYNNRDLDIDKELEDLTDRYNRALDKAIEEGKINRSDITKEAFNYYFR